MSILSEDYLLSLIDEYFPREDEHLKLGRGDDCCIQEANGELCISSDLFLEGSHFRRDYFSPEEIGYKALAVNVSDIAGMGGAPLGFNMDLMVPEYLDEEFFRGFFKGMSQLARQADIPLAGGDISRAPFLGVSITIWGKPGPSGKLIRRAGSNPGELIFIIGDIGRARVGLMNLEAGGLAAKDMFPAACIAHLRPKPKTFIGMNLTSAPVTALMDVSDGLARDIPRLVGSGKGAALEINDSHLTPDVLKFAEISGQDAVTQAVIGGEDYALVGTIAPDDLSSLERLAPGMQVIGTVTDSEGITLNGKEFTAKGFDHFGG